MSHYPEYGIVKIVNLFVIDRHFDGTASVMTAPKIGDIGAIVHIDKKNLSEGVRYIVEKVDSFGNTIWLADFHHEELEWIQMD